MRYHQEYDQPPTAFAAWLITQLHAHRLSEWRLARRLDVDIHTIMGWRHGTLPKPHACLKLADYFHVPLAQIYALAGIPLRAQHELDREDWYGVPDIGIGPVERLMLMLPHMGLSVLQQQIVIQALVQKERAPSLEHVPSSSQ